MRKVVSSKQILASTALAASLAVFGCTTNKIPGDGQPSSMPYHSPATAAPTNGTSGGARPGTSGGITPMISSGPASMTTPGVEAYAVIAQSQGFRGRILGPSFPGQSSVTESIAPTGQFQNPALVANPEVTVNRSASSDATPAVINDSGTGITIVSGTSVSGTTAASTVTGTTAAATVAGTGTTTAATGAIATPSQVVTGTPTLTQSSLGVPSPTMSVSPVAVPSSSTASTVATTTTPTATATVTPTTATTRSRAIGNLSVPSAASLPTMISSSGSNTTAVRSASTQPATVTSASRTRAVRLTTTTNGTPMITNAQ